MKSTKDSLLEDIKAEFAEVNAMMEALEAKEPEDEASEAYDKWIEECEQLAIESESLMTLIDYKMGFLRNSCDFLTALLNGLTEDRW